MNKTTFITLLFIFGIIIVLAVFLFSLQTKTEPSKLPPSSVVDMGGTVKIQSGLQFSDPKESTNFESIGSGVYISDERKLGNDSGFSVAYFEEDGSFAISLTGKPFALYHEKASRYLLDTLKISEAEACTLNVYVGVTYDTDPSLSGKNFGLSFCPGSVQL